MRRFYTAPAPTADTYIDKKWADEKSKVFILFDHGYPPKLLLVADFLQVAFWTSRIQNPLAGTSTVL